MTKYEIGASEDILVNLVLNTILYLYHFHFTCLHSINWTSLSHSFFFSIKVPISFQYIRYSKCVVIQRSQRFDVVIENCGSWCLSVLATEMRVSEGCIKYTCSSVADGSLPSAPPDKSQITEPNSRDRKSYPTCHTWLLFCTIHKIAFICTCQHFSSGTVVTYHARFLALHVRDQRFIPWFTTNFKISWPHYNAFHALPTYPTENQHAVPLYDLSFS
jgi:hypothetical protein